MSDFKTEVVRIKVVPHPGADRLEIAMIGDYQSIVGLDQFESGDLVAYIQEGSIVPEDILEELGLVGRLAGPDENRVKAVRLRGVLSQGICYPARDEWSEGDDVSEELGVTKYVPPIPPRMSGEVYAAGGRRTIKYDIENFKRYPDVLEEGEEVVFAEKIHGTFAQIGVLSPQDAHPEYGRLAVVSKGLGSKGLCFKPDVEANAQNLYLRAARKENVLEKFEDREESVFILGEVFGNGVQDLGYGAHTKNDEDLGFRVFDVYVGTAKSPEGRYLDDDELDAFCSEYELERVPVLYRGPFSKAIMKEYTDGPETVSGEESHIREGIVMRPVKERRDVALGRVQLKSVSDDYLTRGGDATEYN